MLLLWYLFLSLFEITMWCHFNDLLFGTPYMCYSHFILHNILFFILKWVSSSSSICLSGKACCPVLAECMFGI